MSPVGEVFDHSLLEVTAPPISVGGTTSCTSLEDQILIVLRTIIKCNTTALFYFCVPDTETCTQMIINLN